MFKRLASLFVVVALLNVASVGVVYGYDPDVPRGQSSSQSDNNKSSQSSDKKNQPSASGGSSSSSSSSAQPVVNKFCVSIDKTVTRTQNSLANQAKVRHDKFDETTQKIEKERKDTQAKIASNRTNNDSKYEAAYAALLSKADTDAKKTAVAAYKTTVTSAMQERRTSNDTARQLFRDKFDALRKDRFNKREAIFDARDASVKEALKQAQAQCRNNVDGAKVRATLLASIHSANAQKSKALKDLPSYSDQVKALVSARNDAIKASAATFRAKKLEAKKALLLVLRATVPDEGATAAE